MIINWINSEFTLNDILTINERKVLEHAGHIRKQLADEMAGKENEKFKALLIEKATSLNQLEADLNNVGSSSH